MKNQLSPITTVDYRNARYQGRIDHRGNRHSLGILIDDDLSFYISHWNQNLLDQQTLVYISHGNYIYGRWHNNQPHGLNVFRTGDTVLVGQFRNGKLFGKILVIFQRYNIIAILETRPQRDRFDVLECGKLITHNDLLKYIDMLDIEMPDSYFSLIKFITSLSSDDEDQFGQSLIASPCEGQNCYFGYRDGLAIIFNSNNGVVSVGQHSNKKLNGFGGKFDGKKIEQGNFELEQTITYQKKRPDNEIYMIFQKMHKRSLNFKNQYFDSKIKTLGDLQTILRNNIQKIVNYNMKIGIRQATAQDLNDSLDYQNLQGYQSIRSAQNRQNMYEKQTRNLKKTASEYYQQDKQKRCFSKSPKPIISDNTSRRPSRINKETQSQTQYEVQQTVRRMPGKDLTVVYAKKSPIRFNQEENQVYGKQSKNQSRHTQSCYEEEKNQKYYPKPIEKEQSNIGRMYKRNSVYDRGQKNYERSPLSHSKNLEPKIDEKQCRDKLPKFGGLEIEQTQKQIHKSKVQNQVEQYKRQLQKSRSKQKLQGKSIGKYLKRPNYQDIQERRKRILNQFKELNEDSHSHSKISSISQNKRIQNKVYPEIDINQNYRQSQKNSIAQSPCMKEKILSYTSENDITSQNSEDGCLPLSLVNADKNRYNRNRPIQQKIQNKSSAFSKRASVIEKLDNCNSSTNKQNVSYTPGPFTKYKKEADSANINSYVNEKKNQIRKFYCQDTQQHLDQLIMTKNTQSQHLPSESQEDDDNKFSEIELKPQISQKADSFNDNRQRFTEKQGPSKSRQQMIAQKQASDLMRENYGNTRDKALNQRELSPSIVSDVSRRKTGYKYYFEE